MMDWPVRQSATARAGGFVPIPDGAPGS